MIFTDIMKNMKIYRKPLFLPTLDNDKKKGSSVLLFTPNYESSKRLMEHPLLINRLRYQSYYAERDLTKFISSKVLSRVEEASIEKEDVLQEYNLFKNKDHIIYHPEGIRAGTKNNIMFVTGYSGGGKSTYANVYGGFHNTHVIHGDFLFAVVKHYNRKLRGQSYNPKFDVENPESKNVIDDMIYIYLKDRIQDHVIEGDHIHFEDPIFVKYWENFVIWLKKESQTEKYKKDLFIVEGVQIYMSNPELYKDYTIVIMGTSAKTAWLRKSNRDVFQPGKYDWKHIKSLFTTIGMYIKSSKDIDQFINSMNESYIEERYFKTEDDIYYNKDKFDRGETNLCFITGQSGSGKSTMGRNLSNDKVEHYELDDVVFNKLHFTINQLKEYGDLIYSFFNGVGNKYFYTEKDFEGEYPKLKSGFYIGDNYERNIINDFVDYAIKYAKNHKNKKYILEGIWLYMYVDPNKLVSYAVYIKGTSALRSASRGYKREIQFDKMNGESPRLIDKIQMRIRYLKGNFSDEKFVERYRKFFSDKLSDIRLQPQFEAAIYPDNIPKDIIEFSKKMNSEFKYGVIGLDGKFLDGFDNYKTLTITQFEKYKTGVCWDYTHYEAKWFKDHGYKYETYYIEVQDEDGDCPSHTFLVFYLNSKVYYFESSWGRYKGIEEFSNLSTLMKTVIDRHCKENKGTKQNTAFYQKFDAASASFEHLNCAQYYKKASGGKTMAVFEAATKNRESKFDWSVSGDKPPYKPVPIEKEYGVMAENRYNACIKLKGYKPLRGRSEVLIVNDQDQVFLCFGKWGPYDYELPGGSWDKGEDHMQCVIREAMEEARIKVKDITQYLPYVATYEPDDWQNEHIPKAMQWYGDYNDLYIARYNGYYDGPVEEEDKESRMLKNGRFYDFKSIEHRLDPGHAVAIAAYLYQGLADQFDEDREGTFELLHHIGIGPRKIMKEAGTPMRSNLDKDFKSKGKLSLSKFKRLPLSKVLINKYKDQSKLLRHLDPRDNGYFFIDDSGEKGKVVAIVAVDDKRANAEELRNYNCITAIEVFPEYRGYGLSKQLLDVATKELKADFLTVAYDNEVAIKLYKDYGFKIEKSSYDIIQQGKNIPGDRKTNMYIMIYKTHPGDHFELVGESCKDLVTARRLSKEVEKLAKKYNANYFFVTDGASSYSNGNGKRDPAVANARDKMIEWEKENGYNPDEDWRNDITNTSDYRLKESLLFDHIDWIQEDAKYDTQLKRLFYNDRIKQRKQLMELDKQVKADLPFIKSIYIEPSKYKTKNLFIDYSYYNDIFFKNNEWDKKKGYLLYTDLMERIFTDKTFKNLGYKKRTIFIPVLDWKREPGNVWSYKEALNPISVIYELLRSGDIEKLNKMFGKDDVVFFGKDKYFKINFSQLEIKPKELALKYKMFITKILAGQEFDLDDIDTAAEVKESPKAIKANIMDKIESSKGVDLTGKDVKVDSKNKGNIDPIVNNNADSKTLASTEVDNENKDKVLLKGTDTTEQKKKEKDLEKLAVDIDRISQDAQDTDDAIDKMDDLKSIIIDLDSMGDESHKVDAARTARMNKLDQQFLEKQVKGKSVKDILSDDPTKKELETISLDIASPNEEWKEMTYMNFDKDYDLNRDILLCLQHFQTVSNPISIRNIDVKDNSTSEDRVDLYTVEMEDTRGKRFSIKLDIPIMIDNRFLLRGYDKKINTQLCNMPIIKTDLDAAQIITNYRKVFIYRVNTVAGRSNPIAGRLLKAIGKYQGKKLKFFYGDNGKICNKYQLPVDYIDIASTLNKIETPTHVIYLNQDEIRRDYPEIDDSLGVPYAISKKDKTVCYYTINQYGNNLFAYELVNFLIEDEEFRELYGKATPPTSGTYSRCNIMSSKIPMIVVLGYMEGATKTLKKANINYTIETSLTKDIRHSNKGWIRFKDGYLVYDITYTSCMLLNGFKECTTEIYSVYDIDNKNIYLEMLDAFGGRIKADGLDNFYDCLVDPITREVLEHYHLPTDVVSMFLYANMLLSDNKFTKHADVSSRRIRRGEMVAAYTYEALSESYGNYANMMKSSKSSAEFLIKQSSVIDKILAAPISSDDSTINALEAVESTNSITSKGKSGLNSERSYSLDKRTFDDSMINVLGASTGFSGNTGITRQTTMDMGVEGIRGYIKTNNGDTSKMNSAKTLTATEALTPFGSTRDDGMRTAMTFIQTAKHMLRTEQSDPLLVTSGADEALAYMTTDKFAFKAKDNGKIKELTEDYMIISYDNGTNDYINLKETVEKNSDAGCYVPLKLNVKEGLRVGRKFKRNEILAYDRLSFSNSVGESDNIAYNIGKLAKVAIINTDEGYEDSGVCTEDMSEKLESRIIIKEDHNIDRNSTIFSIVKVGQDVDVNDALLIWQDPYEEEDANILLKALAKDQEQVSELGRRVVRSEVAGKVSDIRIYRTVELDELSDSLRKLVESYEKEIKKLKKKLDSEGINTTNLPPTYKLEQTGKLKNTDGVKIEIFVEYRDIVAVGDKVVYFSANKATSKTVIPKGNEPYTDFRPNEPIDAFVSEVSIDKRMVGSTMSYGSLQKLMIELDRTCKDMAGIPYDDTTV